MLLELDSDQQLWQKTVADFLVKQCPAASVRRIAEGDAQPDELWQSIVAQGWTELAESGETVELVIALEELGRVADAGRSRRRHGCRRRRRVRRGERHPQR